MSETIPLSDEDSKNLIINLIKEKEASLPGWKTLLATYPLTFLGQDEKPVVKFISEGVELLTKIRDSLEQNNTVYVRDIKAIAAWNDSDNNSQKQMVREWGNLMRSAQRYAAITLALQGQNIDDVGPREELGKGETRPLLNSHMHTFVAFPLQLDNLMATILLIVKNANPVLASKLDKGYVPKSYYGVPPR